MVEPDTADAIVLSLIAMRSQAGETTHPSPPLDADAVIREQLTENTGSHLMDSGAAYGRHHEENRENPPWGKPEWNVGDGYVTKNLYHHLVQTCDRDTTAVHLEAALWAWKEEHGGSWLSASREFARAVVEDTGYSEDFRELGLPAEIADTVAGVSRTTDGDVVSGNTYNSEFGSTSQDFEFRMLGGHYAEYAIVHVHGGCDIRGGYTAPRVYQVSGLLPHEYSFSCTRCDWSGVESVVWDSDELLFQSTVRPEELEEELKERAPEHVTPEDVRDAVNDSIDSMPDGYDGAIWHIGDGCGGFVELH